MLVTRTINTLFQHRRILLSPGFDSKTPAPGVEPGFHPFCQLVTGMCTSRYTMRACELRFVKFQHIFKPYLPFCQMDKRGKFLKFVMLSFLLILLVVAGYFLYLTALQLSAEPMPFTENKTTSKPTESSRNQSSYAGELQFYPNMRFSKKELRYNIEESCSDEKKKRVLQAFSRIENETGMLRFFGTTEQIADILIKCEETETEEIPGEYYIAGEGGATSIINNTLFYIIEKGKILLYYKKSSCDNYNIELHELLHVLGFKHSENKQSIMYNTSSCNQLLTLDIVDELKRIYSIEELPDLTITNVSATQHSLYYLNFNIEVRNQGLIIVENVKLELYADYGREEKVEVFDLAGIGYGEGKLLEVKNLKMPSRKVQKIKFVLIDGEELNEENNIISLFLSD